MADLVAEMAQQRAVRLVQVEPPALSLHVVGLGDIEGDHAVRVSREDRWGAAVLGIGKKLVGQSVLRVVKLVRDRATELEQACKPAAAWPSRACTRLPCAPVDSGRESRGSSGMTSTENADRPRESPSCRHFAACNSRKGDRAVPSARASGDRHRPSPTGSSDPMSSRSGRYASVWPQLTHTVFSKKTSCWQ